MELSRRLQAVADMVTVGMHVADVGTDHGYIPIHLVQTKKIPGAIAMDINQGPLDRAIDHIKENKLEAFIKTRLSDGMAALSPGEAECLVIAGVGGGLITRILSGHKLPEGMKELVLQPQSELSKVRTFLRENEYHIIKEDMVIDEGKFYTILKVIKNTLADGNPASADGNIDFYGNYLLEHRHPVLAQFIHREIKLKEALLKKLNQRTGAHIDLRIEELKEEVTYAKQILYRYYEDDRSSIPGSVCL